MEMKTLCYVLVLVILTENTRSDSTNCRIFHEKSTIPNGQQEYYIDDRGQYVCCRAQYLTLYSYAVCNFVTLHPGKRLYYLDDDPDIKYIVFRHSDVPLIPVGVFSEFSTVLQLYVNNSNVNAIHPGAFNGLAKLEELYLENNHMTELTRGILNSMSNLKLLNMSNNRLTIIEDNALLGLLNLQQVDLSYNNLKILSPNVFNGLSSVQCLNLSHNYIAEISPTIFSNITKHNNHLLDFIVHDEDYLEESSLQVDLSYNNLSIINCSYFPISTQNLNLGNNYIEYLENLSYLFNLHRLDLSNNKITDIKGVSVNLNYLNASGNKIEQLDDMRFHELQNLTTLDFSFNLITNLHEDSFQGVKYILHLYLQNNKLNKLPIGCFSDLNRLLLLNISSNRITEFDHGTFAGLYNLQQLDISNNTLTDLFEGTFHSLTSLQILNIGDNFLTSFDTYNFLININNLRKITLNNNPWNCKSLLKIITNFQSKSIEVINGPVKKVTNIHGIACLDYGLNNTKERSRYIEIPRNNQIVKNFSTNSNELEMLRNYFNGEFLNSSFYNFFNNSKHSFGVNASLEIMKYFDDGFKNTTFYKYFNQDVSNTTFFKSFNKTLFKNSVAFTKILDETLNTTVNKFSKSDALTRGFSKYFEDGYKNSSFYKYFTEEFANSNFFKFFNEERQTKLNLTLAEIVSELRLLRTFLASEFKNNTYYHLLEQEYVNRYLNLSKLGDVTPGEFLYNNSKSFPSSEKQIDSLNLQDDHDILAKISDLKNGITVLMIIVIIILICMMLLFTFKNFFVPLKRSMRNQSPIKANNLGESASELELM